MATSPHLTCVPPGRAACVRVCACAWGWGVVGVGEWWGGGREERGRGRAVARARPYVAASAPLAEAGCICVCACMCMCVCVRVCVCACVCAHVRFLLRPGASMQAGTPPQQQQQQHTRRAFCTSTRNALTCSPHEAHIAHMRPTTPARPHTSCTHHTFNSPCGCAPRVQGILLVAASGDEGYPTTNYPAGAYALSMHVCSCGT